MASENISGSIGFHGVWVDLLVPLQVDLNIDEPKLASHLRNLSAKGFENFVLFGQAGEGTSFSTDEKLSALAYIIEAGVDANNIMLGVNSSSYTEVAKFIRKACAKGVRRYLVSPPQYDYPYNNVGLFDYYDQIIKQVNQPNWQLFIHQLGGKNQAADLPEAVLADLKKNYPRTFVGIVDQDVHVNHTVELLRAFDNALVIASCHEPNLTILHPTDVCVSALANVMPNVIKNVIAHHFVNNATKVAGMKVAKPDDRVIEFMTVLGNYPQVAALKLMLAQHYRMESWERVRPPHTTLPKEAKDKLIAAFKTFNLQATE
jgi:4-hydroxy-tetrahydrodipicolinate synthase